MIRTHTADSCDTDDFPDLEEFEDSVEPGRIDNALLRCPLLPPDPSCNASVSHSAKSTQSTESNTRIVCANSSGESSYRGNESFVCDGMDMLALHRAWVGLLDKRAHCKSNNGVEAAVAIPGLQRLLELFQMECANPSTLNVLAVVEQVAKSKRMIESLQVKLDGAQSSVRRVATRERHDLQEVVDLRNRARKALVDCLQKQRSDVIKIATCLSSRGKEKMKTHSLQALGENIEMLENEIKDWQDSLHNVCEFVSNENLHEKGFGKLSGKWNGEPPTAEEALDLYNMFWKRCSIDKPSLATDAAIQAFDTEKSVPLFSKGLTNSNRKLERLSRLFREATLAINHELHSWETWNPPAWMPIDQLTAAAHAVLHTKRSAATHMKIAVDISIEFESLLESVKGALDFGSDLERKVDDFQAATEARLDSRENLDLAQLRVEHSRRRNKDPTSEDLANVTLAKDMVRQAEGHLLQATIELIKFEHDFPEIVVHFKAGLPAELWDLWRAERSLQHFDECIALQTSSRNRVYRVKEGEHEFAVKEFTVTESSLRMCYHEATMLHRMRHPHIAKVVALFEDPQRHSFYLQMPFYANGGIDDWIVTSQPDDSSVLRALTEVLSALVHLHTHGIVHADVKPQNMLIDSQGRACLADFDVSIDQATRISSNHVTRVGFTPNFAAPDLFTTGATFATDMFAFGESLRMVGEISTFIKKKELEVLIRRLKDDVPEKRPHAQSTLDDPLFEPVFQWRKKEMRKCCVMASESCTSGSQLCSLQDGLECSTGSHFTCSSCLDKHVQSMSTWSKGSDRTGFVYCPCSPSFCNSDAFTDGDLARHLSATRFQTYLNQRTKVLERRLAEEFESEMKARLESERKRLENMNVHQQEVLRARNHIVEEILTLKCPVCRQAFVDFDGCFALKCIRCSCHFCAWCSAKAGDANAQGDRDAHVHVRNCSAKPRGADIFFGTHDQFNEAQNNRRRTLLRAFLDTLSSATKEVVIREIRHELDELGLLDVGRNR